MTSRPAAAIVVVIILAIVVLVRVWPRRKPTIRLVTNPIPGISDPSVTTPPMPFGYKTAWFAIRSEDAKAVATALELQNVRSAGWSYGVWHALETDDYAIFITPPMQGWILATGVPILYEADDHATDRMVELSRQFGETQLFASMRISSSYLWAKALNGKLERRFYDADGQHQETGEPTEAEKAMGLRFFNASSPEAKESGYWQRKDLVFVDEEHVLQIAGRWSVNPSKLDRMGLQPAMGLIGEPSGTYPPKPQTHRN